MKTKERTQRIYNSNSHALHITADEKKAVCAEPSYKREPEPEDINTVIIQPSFTQPNGLLTEDELMQWCKFKRISDLIEFLQKNGIVYYRGRGGCICTTLKAINQCLSNKNQTGQTWE